MDANERSGGSLRDLARSSRKTHNRQQVAARRGHKPQSISLQAHCWRTRIVLESLCAPLDGVWSARLMREWRILYEVDDDKQRTTSVMLFSFSRAGDCAADEQAMSPQPGLPMAETFSLADDRVEQRDDGNGCRAGREVGLRQASRCEIGQDSGAAPRPRLRPALSGRRRGKSCFSAAGRVRPGAAGTSPPAISLAEHRVEFGVGPDRPDLLRAAAGDGDLGSPPQRLLA